MILDSLKHASNWRVADLERDQRWVFRIDEATRQEMIDAVLKAENPNKSLLDYRRTDFALSKTLVILSAALEEVKRGLGVALIKGLPRQELTARQFEILSWSLGLYSGVPRPQGKDTQYISAVKDAASGTSQPRCLSFPA